MNVPDDQLRSFINTFYGGQLSYFKEDLNTIIFYLHYVESEVISPNEIRDSCFVLKKLIEACGE